MQEELKEAGDTDSSSSEDEDAALQDLCEPESNVLGELQAEQEEGFDLDSYLQFRATLGEANPLPEFAMGGSAGNNSMMDM